MKNWKIDLAHSSVNFSVRHMGLLNVRGTFDGITASFVTNEQNEVQSFKGVIDIHSVNTRDESRDAHIKAEDFLNASAYPTMTLTSKKVTKVNPNLYDITADMTIKGITGTIDFSLELTNEITDSWGLQRMAAETSFTINRKDFGITWNQTMDNGGLLVGNDIKVHMEVEFTL